MMEIRELIFGLIGDALYLLISAGIFYLITFLRKKIDADKLQLTIEIIETAVLFAQQKFGDSAGQIKFEMALQHAAMMLNNKGIKVEKDELENLIESVLRRLKLEYGDSWNIK